MYYIQQASHSDIHGLAELFHQYRMHATSLGDPGSQADCEKWIEQCFELGHGLFWLARECGSDELLGFVTLYKGYSSISLCHYWVMNDLFVIEHARCQGIASALIDEVVAFARQTNAKGIELETATNNLTAQRLYLRHGFEPARYYQRYFLLLADEPA